MRVRCHRCRRWATVGLVAWTCLCGALLGRAGGENRALPDPPAVEANVVASSSGRTVNLAAVGASYSAGRANLTVQRST